MFCSSIYKNVLAICLALGLAGCAGSASDTNSSDVGSDSDLSQNDRGYVVLNWQKPTKNADGSELMNLTGYKIYYGTSEDNLDQLIHVYDPNLTEYIIKELQSETTYYFVISSINTDSIEGPHSNIVSKHITG